MSTMLSTGDEPTIGNYIKHAIQIWGVDSKAVQFLRTKAQFDEKGEAAIIEAPEDQVCLLLEAIMIPVTENLEFKDVSHITGESQEEQNELNRQIREERRWRNANNLIGIRTDTSDARGESAAVHRVSDDDIRDITED